MAERRLNGSALMRVCHKTAAGCPACTAGGQMLPVCKSGCIKRLFYVCRGVQTGMAERRLNGSALMRVCHKTAAGCPACAAGGQRLPVCKPGCIKRLFHVCRGVQTGRSGG